MRVLAHRHLPKFQQEKSDYVFNRDVDISVFSFRWVAHTRFLTAMSNVLLTVNRMIFDLGVVFLSST